MSGRGIVLMYTKYYALCIHLVLKINVFGGFFHKIYLSWGFPRQKEFNLRKRGFVRGMNELQGNLTPFLLKSSS